MPIWITPGEESVDTANIDYESNNPKDSSNWFCENCDSHHFPVSLDGDNSCDECGLHDRVEGSELCKDCKAIDDGDEVCEHTGMTRDELESLCGTPATKLYGFGCAPDAIAKGYTKLREMFDGTEASALARFKGEDVAIVKGASISEGKYEFAIYVQHTEQRADAKITELIRDVKDGDCALSAIFDDGSERKLFSFFIDELAFFDADLIGKTEAEAHQLHSARIIAYIQS
jgi:hypothetical protein